MKQIYTKTETANRILNNNLMSYKKVIVVDIIGPKK